MTPGYTLATEGDKSNKPAAVYAIDAADKRRASVCSATEKGGGGGRLPRVHTADVQDVELQGAPGPQEPHLLAQQPAAAHHQGHVVQQLGGGGFSSVNI